MPDTNRNHLISTQSPYLLQHVDNPVHWFPWGDDAFDEARRQDKPIFLSIGYATCHWCHVMAHESFEDETVAGLMNEAFINVKVDREERPDIDNTYMHVCQMLTGHGGWPLTIIMTPDKKPFYAATYIPKNGRHGQPGMMELIPRLSHLWENEREKINGSAQEITHAFQQSIQPHSGNGFSDDILSKTYSQLTQTFDTEHGGFGSAPKFPTPHTLTFLLRYGHHHNNKKAIAMAEKTLTKMRQGGLFDHIGYGFHRYSTDSQWLLPHFEKMLYDQAMHLMAYTEGWQRTGNPLFKQTAEEITAYLLRDLQDEGGAFYSAEDADSEGEEGTFYVWSVEEIREVLPPADAELTIEVFNITEEGNFTDEASAQKTGKNILHLTKPIKELAAERNMDEETLRGKLEAIRQQLFAQREKRERPFLDDKILTDWNGLTIAALAKAGRALDEPQCIHGAERAASFILQNVVSSDGTLLHRYRNGEAAITGTADDYAFLIWGLLELYEATFKTNYLEEAVLLNGHFISSHWDSDNGGFYFTATGQEELLGRKKEYFDSALPSANSVAMMNLLRLGRMTANTNWEQKADQIARSVSDQATKALTSFTQLMQAHIWATYPSYEIVIAGKKDQLDTEVFIQKLYEIYLPNAVLLLNEENDTAIQELAPFLKNQPIKDGKATAYVCRNYSCEEPTHDVEQMMDLLLASSDG